MDGLNNALGSVEVLAGVAPCQMRVSEVVCICARVGSTTIATGEVFEDARAATAPLNGLVVKPASKAASLMGREFTTVGVEADPEPGQSSKEGMHTAWD